MFWREVFESVKALLQIYGGMLGGVAVLGLLIATVWLIGTGIGKGLEWLGVPALLTEVWAAVLTIFGKIKEVARTLTDLGWRALGFLTSVTFTIIAPTLGPWVFVYLVFLGGSRIAIPWAVGSITLALPLCLIGWPLLLRMDKERPKLSHLPIVIAIAVLWVAPIIAALPIAMTSD